MSQWAGIESGTAPAAPHTFAGDPAAPRRPAPPRLRRTERLIVGSIDGAAHVLQRRARDVLLGTAAFMLPVLGLGVLMSVIAYRDFDHFDGLFDGRGYIGAEIGLVFATVLVQSLTAHLAGAYAAVYLVRHQLGGSPRVRDAAGAVLRRLPLLLFTWLLTHGWAPLFALWLLRSDASTAAGLAWILGFAASLASAAALLVVPVVMSEHLGVRSLGRAWRLVRARFSAAWGFVLACSLLGSVLLLFITYLPSLAEDTGLVTFGRFRWLAQGVAAQVALLVVVPFSALATAQFYLQTRIHAEGLDIQLAADRAFGASR